MLLRAINAYNVFNMKKAAVGELEQLVLLAVLRLRDNAYTVAIREEIAGRAGRRLSRGAVYATLERLERKGLLSSHFGEPSPERGGKAKKFFHGRAEFTRYSVTMFAARNQIQFYDCTIFPYWWRGQPGDAV